MTEARRRLFRQQ